MIEPRFVEEADVFRNDTRVGTLRRTAAGSTFRYDDAFYATHATRPGGIAVQLPYATREIETRGTNLHAFFAGLLPEGLRLRSLVQRSKTSEDDLFTLLIAAGPDTVGDIRVVRSGEAPRVGGASIAPRASHRIRFSDLWKRVLEGTARDEPSIAGVQEKVSPAMVSFPIAGRARHTQYILKLNPADKPRLVENEHFVMQLARACGIATARTWLVHDRDREPGLLVERFDRRWDARARTLVGLHVEDACQLLDRYPADKYRLSCADVARAFDVCAAPIPARATFLHRLAFSYVVCNGDLHAKNVSVIESPVGLVPTPAYDLLASLPYGDRRMALILEGRDDNLRRRDFLAFATRHGVASRAVEAMIDRLLTEVVRWVDRVGEIGLSARKTADLQRTMRKRIDDLRA